jgi:mannose-6-phosphate isomerase-like protein (cupin superfamily)
MTTGSNDQSMQRELPIESYINPPKESFNPSEYLFRFAQIPDYYDVPGEFGHMLEGQLYGFEALSFFITETHPGGGPPLHTHTVEEAHILLSGTMSYLIGDEQFSAEGPYVVKIPAHVPHTFINSGDQPLRLIAVLAGKECAWEELGPNPLVKQ